MIDNIANSLNQERVYTLPNALYRWITGMAETRHAESGKEIAPDARDDGMRCAQEERIDCQAPPSIHTP